MLREIQETRGYRLHRKSLPALIERALESVDGADETSAREVLRQLERDYVSWRGAAKR